MRPRIIFVCILLLASIMTARAATYETLHNFVVDGWDGLPPLSDLVFDQYGSLYGVAAYAGSDYTDGLVFGLSPSPQGWNYWIVRRFYDFEPLGREPLGGIVIDGAGTIYGTNSFTDDDWECGVVFKSSPDWGPLHTFTGPDGCIPRSNVRVSDGWLFGTTSAGGAYGQGTVFSIDIATADFHSYSFQKTNGNNPRGGFNNFFYGTTLSGGGRGEGNIYRLGPHGLINKFSFASNRPAGYAPMGDLLTANVKGVRTMYGTNTAGGKGGGGTVYQLTENQQKPETWQLKVLHSFSGRDGRTPMAGLTSDARGNLYGTTSEGGKYGCGTVFKLSRVHKTQWKFTTVYHFDEYNPKSGGDGCSPRSSVVLDSAGNIYGTTEWGGWGFGTVYKITR